MIEKVVSWDEFKASISSNIKTNSGPLIFRGQGNSKWKLTSSFHRNPNGFSFEDYFNLLERLCDQVGTLEKRKIDISTGTGIASFLVHLQHYGYPTPILDFSLSPYIASFFSYADFDSKAEFVSIYQFDYLKWLTHYEQIYDYKVIEPHVSVLNPKLDGNLRQYNQWGHFYLFSNVIDIEAHICSCESTTSEYLVKYNIPVSEHLYAVLDLEQMGITHYSLFGTTEAWCKMMKDVFFTRNSNGKGALDHLKKIQELNLSSAPLLNEINKNQDKL